MDFPAFIPAGGLSLCPPAARAPLCGGRPRAAAAAGRVRMASEIGQDDKEEVRDYFTNTGFGRWNKIYSDDDSVNAVQKDIREGHAKTVETILSWVDEDGDAQGQTFCDAGCGVGSLAIPLASRGAVVTASDISPTMAAEAQRRAIEALPASDAARATFKTSDLCDLDGFYDTVACVDVMIHYPQEDVNEMISALSALAKRRLIVSFAPKTFAYSLLKKVGEFFPGPSKATRAYLHAELDVVAALEAEGWTVKRRGSTASKFYFSNVLEAVREA